MIVSSVITEAIEGGYAAFNPENGTMTQGETFDEAVANLREATELYLEIPPLNSSEVNPRGLTPSRSANFFL
jgi:predicted RNase H-like HicB family nuclease